MIINETKSSIQFKISELLSSIDCDWRYEKLGEDKYRFFTELDGINFNIFQRKVSVTKGKTSIDGVYDEEFIIESENKKSSLYSKLLTRFKEDKEILFYNEVLQSINNIIESREKEAHEQIEKDELENKEKKSLILDKLE
jgi:hypothetical protein